MMQYRFDNDDNDSGISFRDVVMGMMGLLGAIVIILLLLPKEPDKAADEAERSRGNVRVEIYWPNDMNVDIDLWGKAPNLPSVGYSNSSGAVLSLVRDDLGNIIEITPQNYEIMFSRGLPKGEWVFNIHWFSNSAGVSSVPVTVLITIIKDDSTTSKSRPQQVVSTQLILYNVGQELTIIRFKLDGDGDIAQDSMTSLFKPIRALGSN